MPTRPGARAEEIASRTARLAGGLWEARRCALWGEDDEQQRGGVGVEAGGEDFASRPSTPEHLERATAVPTFSLPDCDR
jgi:hypothetical protein